MISLNRPFTCFRDTRNTVSRERDEYGRFPWEASIQYKLGITGIPVVNYYFEVILEAFEPLLCQINGLPIQQGEREAPVLFLSHDVDRIKKYSFRNMVYMWPAVSRNHPIPKTSFPKGSGTWGLYPGLICSRQRIHTGISRN